MKYIPGCIIVLFVLTGCASGQVAVEQTQAYSYEAYDHKRCIGYEFDPLSPEYSQCRKLLQDMRGGDALGIASGMALDNLIKQKGRQPNEQEDFSKYGVAAGGMPRPAPEDFAKYGIAGGAPPVPPPPKPSTTAYGTGFFVSSAGHIITNQHVVDGCGTIKTRAGQVLNVIRSDKELDVALLQADGYKPKSVAPFRDDDVEIGASVIVFGFPLPGYLATSGNLTTGTVNATSGLGDDGRHVQISAPVQPGNSGGPLLDEYGAVVGVVVAKLNTTKMAAITGGDIAQNVNFAIKATQVAAFLKRDNVTPKKAGWTFLKRATTTIAALAADFTVQIICHSGGRD